MALRESFPEFGSPALQIARYSSQEPTISMIALQEDDLEANGGFEPASQSCPPSDDRTQAYELTRRRDRVSSFLFLVVKSAESSGTEGVPWARCIGGG